MIESELLIYMVTLFHVLLLKDDILILLNIRCEVVIPIQHITHLSGQKIHLDDVAEDDTHDTRSRFDIPRLLFRPEYASER